MTRTELLALATERGVVGRWRMSKAELLAALTASDGGHPRPEAVPDPDDIPVRRIPDEPRGGDRGRRARLAERLAAVVDADRRCDWTAVDGVSCGLPAVVDRARCALHGGIDVYDRAVAVTGRLGFDTWPTHARHLARATYDVDPIGLDPVVAEMVWHLVNFLYFDYFRVEVEGAEHLPASGAALVVANHGGGFLPYDAAILNAVVANEPEVPRRLRVIGTEIFNMLPWVSHLYRKAGAAYAARGDVVHLLGAGRIVGVFPEGERGFMKPREEAYRVQRLGRGGFVELAEEFSAPIIPAAIVGAEEVHPAVGTSQALARLVRVLFPQQRVEEVAVVLNPIPLPIRWHIRILPPVRPTGGGAAADPLWVLEQTEAIRASIQSSLDSMVARRR
jgi:1-acyl-sn-glycerol-3-phosphate acyltransferase